LSIPRRQRGPVAWLAIVALWLTIVAPVVSQTLASPLDALIGIGACGVVHADGTQSPPTGHPLEKCGYCGLLAGHSLLPDAAPALVPGLALPDRWLTAALPPERGTVVLLAAAPRGPPSSSFHA
jgi:hypothetical protein